MCISLAAAVRAAAPSCAASATTQNASASNDHAANDFFESKIRPLLTERCGRCHFGSNAKGGVRLDGPTGKDAAYDPNVLVPGQPDQSPLIRAVEHSGDAKMPPNSKLDQAQISDLKKWIAQGAYWPRAKATSSSRANVDHWAFKAVTKPKLPAVRNEDWPRSPIDRFVLAKLEAAGLQPVADADPTTLLRRVHFDLVGLPPTPEEADAFLADRRPDAFERLVDRLLESPRYGERWGRHWMDVVRYADTAGDNADYPIPEARLYRDYIIDSFNADVPYDRFVREQLAGDLIASTNDSADGSAARNRIVATGFLALSRRYATAPYEFWHLTLEDAIDTVGQGLLAMTFRCARCHDHKFDPISMRDYYALYGIFDSTRLPWAGGEEFQSKSAPRMHFVSLSDPSAVAIATSRNEQRKRALKASIEQFEKNHPLLKEIASLDGQVAALDRKIVDAAKAATSATELRSERKKLDERRKKAKKELQSKLQAERDELRLRERGNLPPEIPVAYAAVDGTPGNARVQQRGNPETLGQEVARGDLSGLPFGKRLAIGSNESGRKQLAEWLTSTDHPLTARVIVNRIWMWHMGKGLVATPSNFGTRGLPPSHPELLDHLASEFMANGWSIKKLHRAILKSRTWQLASTGGARQWSADPENRLYWRMDRRRLDAEAIRDAALAVAGPADGLDLARPGPHPFPPLHRWNWTQHNPFREIYPSRHRSVYLMTPRLQRHPYLALFDGPDTNATTGARSQSTVPLQALYLMNGDEATARAKALANRILHRETEATESASIELAYRLVYCRLPMPEETKAAKDYLTRYARANDKAGNPEKARLAAWTSWCRTLLASNEFVYID